MSEQSRPDLRAIEQLVRDTAIPLLRDHSHVAEVLRLAADTISAQRLSAMALHRRVQEAEAATTESARLAKAQSRAAWANAWTRQSFQRMMDAFNEIKRIYEEFRRAAPDGCDDYGYHSVMDSRADCSGPQIPGAVWANRYKSRKGGAVSVRVADLAKPLIDELLALRALADAPSGVTATGGQVGPGNTSKTPGEGEP